MVSGGWDVRTAFGPAMPSATFQPPSAAEALPLSAYACTLSPDPLTALPGRWGHAACCPMGGGPATLVGGFGAQPGQAAGHARLSDAVVVAPCTPGGGAGGATRHAQTPAGIVGGRMYAACAALPSGRVLLFGGRGSPAPGGGHADLLEVIVDERVEEAKGEGEGEGEGEGGNGVQYRAVEVSMAEGSGPTKRWRHAMAALGEGAVMLFGGWDGARPLGDAWMLEALEREGREGREGGWAWRPVCFSGDAPGARFGHTLTAVDANTAVLYGGYDGAGVMHADAHVLRRKERGEGEEGEEWVATRVAVEAAGRPIGRYAHAAFAFDGGLFVVGGVTWEGEAQEILHLDWATGRWARVPLDQGGEGGGRVEGRCWVRTSAVVCERGDREATVAWVGGGLLAFSFGSVFSPLVSRLLLRRM